MNDTTVPDVTVIVAVYNTMPYLTECLTSLAGQSIGPGRMEVVAVDDGSTDGGGEELDRFAEMYPGVFRVMHQANSGGPAVPSNRALDVARGRYVFFLGADDYLGTEALERMVRAADEYGSDVLLGRTEGVNGRNILQDVYERTEPDLDLYASALPWSLSNTKLFRRSHIEAYGLRFPEDMPVCSDQPFTIEACVRAGRISVLADYTYYYAVRRDDDTNLTYSSPPLTRLAAGETIIETTAALLEPGPKRDFVLKRHFAWELAKLLRKTFLDCDQDTRVQLCANVEKLCDRYLTEGIREQLTARQRLRLALACRGAVDELAETLRVHLDGEHPPLMIDGDTILCCLPGYGDERLAIPDDCYTLTGSLIPHIAATGCEARWQRRLLALKVRTTLYGSPSALTVALAHTWRAKRWAGTTRKVAEGPPRPLGPVTARSTHGDLDVLLNVSELVERAPLAEAVHPVRLYAEITGNTYEIPLPAPEPGPSALLWHQGKPYEVSTDADDRGHLQIKIAPCGLRQVLLWPTRRFGRRP
ncbi:glycosyltransferase family 2 protein [Nonomuraea sp. NPDC046570]|uniref:glycosyltransferase family 2 protein n=1 Tax=Nonomuraea sp. NPDC046570 TaxID=3155255 RepID=UPI0033F05641